MIWKELLHIWISDTPSVNVEIGIVLIGIFLLCILLFLWGKLGSMGGLFFHETELNISLGGIGNVKVKSNHEVAQIAHRAWSELSTRKAGIPIDVEHDLILEIYGSWYNLFQEIRKLIKDIPAQKLRDANTKRLVDTLVKSLNDGLRPHLTKWQAKFKRWYVAEIDKPENVNKTPQEVQKLYPQYESLIADLIQINTQLVAYTSELRKLTTTGWF